MPDNIEQIIRRDLDQLPVLPAEQWIPQSPGGFTVLGRGVKRAALGAVVLVLALAVGTAIGQFRAGVSGVPQVATQPQRTEPIARCSDGRPQSEIDFAGRMLWEPTATEISCVLNATVSGPGANRAYRLTDGRVLNLYERVETVPVKPTVAPVATGSVDVNGATWSWSTLPAGVGQTLLLQGSLAGAPYIELSMALSDQAADLRLLRSIAASLREVATSTRPPNQVAACRSDQLSGTYENNGVASGSYGVSFRLAVATGSCEVPASPPVRFLDANGALILSAAPPTSSGPVQTLRAFTIGKDSGFLLIQWSGHGTEPGYRCATMGPPIASVAVDLGRTALVPDNVLSLDIPSAQRFGFCADPPERVSASIIGSRQPSTAPSPSASAARTAVLERFSRITSEIRRIDRIDAKLMTRDEFEQASAPGATSPYTDPNQVIWVVAISGEVVPQFGQGSVLPWGIYLVAADNGDILGMLAGGGPWPSYFDGLPDRDRR
jgi:hypothetical protein